MTHLRVLLLAALVSATACAHARRPDLGVLDVPIPDVEPPEAPRLPAATSHVPEVASLSLRDKAAQLVMPWIGGEYWASDHAAMEAALRLVREQHVGGFVVGIGTSPYDLAQKFNALQRASAQPLLIAADLESGPAMRIRGGTSFPGNMALGATGRERDAYAVGRVIALEGRAVGIHLVFAPVVDVNNNPSNPIINTRSFGEDPRRVSELGAAFIRGLTEHGMLSTAKHFPGHGDTDTDSHVALPVIAAGRARLDSIELVPFRAAVRAGVDAVMSAHIALPALTGDSAPPATLSSFVLDTLLRRELGFRGLVVTDALNMGAIISRYGAAQAAVLALRAGADILLMPSDAAAAIDAVVEAVFTGQITEARLDSSVARVLATKARAGLFDGRYTGLGRIASVVGTREHRALAEDIAQRSLVLVRDTMGLVPLPPERRRRVVVVTYGDDTMRDAGAWLPGEMRGGVDTLQVFRLFTASGPASYDSVRAAARQAGAVVVCAASRPTAWRPDAVLLPAALASLVEQLSLAGLPVVAASLGSPYVLGQVPHAPAYLVAWTDTELSERAVARALLGRAPVTGRLPVSLPPAYRVGAGLSRPAPAGTTPPRR